MDNLKELISTVLPVLSNWSFVPTASSAQASNFDTIYYFLIYSCTILFFLVVVPMFFFIWKYRRKHEDQKALTQKDHNTTLEIIWSGLPIIYLGILFIWGFSFYLDFYLPPVDAKELRVTGQKWQWTVDYPDDGFSVSGKGAEIGVPLGKPIK